VPVCQVVICLASGIYSLKSILTKADVDEKGGAAVSISYVVKKPILYLGTGQKYEDIREFDKKDVLRTLGLDF